MEILLTEAQEMLKKSAREFLKKECPKTLTRELEQREEGHSQDLWRKMAEMGWLGMLFPERYGGSDSHFLDVALVVEEMGYSALISPFFSTVVESGLLILEAGNEKQKHEFLPRIASGEHLMSLAFIEPDARIDALGVSLAASRQKGGFILNGTKLFVSHARIADHLICIARTRKRGAPEGSISLFLVDARDPGLECRPLHTTASDNQWEVVFKDVHTPGENVLGEWNEGWPPLSRTLQKATALKCAEMLGGARAALDLTVEYAKSRVQFGRPIGSFQAVHHHLADMYRDIVTSRLLTYQAAWRLGEGLPAVKEVAMAKAKLSYAYPAVTRMAHQIHGGAGYYTDYDLEIYYRRALAGQVGYGDTPYHREIIAKELGI